jgi:hypothetical protein
VSGGALVFWLWVFVFYLVADIIYVIAIIGKPRPRITPGAAFIALIPMLWFTYVLISAANAVS